MVNTNTLLRYNRFDIAAKTLYIKFREQEYDSNWGGEVYKEHLKTWNGYSELLDKSKNSFDNFLFEFNKIIDSMKSVGFLKEFPILVDNNGLVINGSHRLATALYFNKEVFIKESDDPGREGQWKCFFDFFKNRHLYPSENNKGFPDLNIKYLDAMACEYCSLKKNTYIISLFPSANHSYEEVNNIIEKKCDIVYKKEVIINRLGLFNLVRHLYFDLNWIGQWSNMFSGIKNKADLCFGNNENNKMFVYLVESDCLKDVVEAKKDIRNIFKIENHSCHSTDSHKETLELSRVLFNKNSIHFLKNAKQKNFKTFNELMDRYKTSINGNILNMKSKMTSEDMCVTSSGVMAAYGLRNVSDLDFIHRLGNYCSFRETNNINGSRISSHYSELKHYDEVFDDILYNPQNHFWYEGVKFATLDVIKKMKKNRGEEKDVIDVELINGILNG